MLLDIGGMKCGGCSAAVKRILGERPEVAGLSVNLLTESAAVRLQPGAAGAAIDGAELARQLADALTAKVLAWQHDRRELLDGLPCCRAMSLAHSRTPSTCVSLKCPSS